MFLRTRSSTFFVDTNVILAYKYGIRKDLLGFIDHKEYSFYYTDTVKKQLEAMEVKPSTRFSHIPSRISKDRGDFAIQFLYEHWTQKFPIGRRFYINEYLSYRDDLLIILEAGYSQFDPLWEKPNIHTLLTSNMSLYHKFFETEEARKVMEDSINLVGLEHLMETKPLDEMIEEWKAYSPPQETQNGHDKDTPETGM